MSYVVPVWRSSRNEPARSDDKDRGRGRDRRQGREDRRKRQGNARLRSRRRGEGRRGGCRRRGDGDGGARGEGARGVRVLGAADRRRRDPVRRGVGAADGLRERSLRNGGRVRERLHGAGDELRRVPRLVARRRHQGGRRVREHGDHGHVRQRQQDGHGHRVAAVRLPGLRQAELHDARQPEARVRRNQGGDGAPHRRRQRGEGCERRDGRPVHRLVRGRGRGDPHRSGEHGDRGYDGAGGLNDDRGIRQRDEVGVGELARGPRQPRRGHGSLDRGAS